MAAIPEPTHSTVRKIYALYEDRRDHTPRPYLGASELGEPCARRLWYGLRWCGGETFKGRMLRLFKRGDQEEAQLLDELRALGVQVEGQQWEVEFAGGHGKGHLDAAVLGLEEAPKSWHVFEAKTHNTKSFADLQKKGLEASKPRHFAQVMVYMGLTGMERAAYFATCKDTDEIYLERVPFDKNKFDRLMNKAWDIVDAPSPLPRISEDASWYECKFCPMHALCHGQARPAVTCRSCAHSTPTVGGAWSCAVHDADISSEVQLFGCEEHRYIPILLEKVAEVEKVDENRVRWRNKLTGKTFDQPRYSSEELFNAADFRVIGDDFVETYKEVFGDNARVTSGAGPEMMPEHGDAPVSDLDAIYGKNKMLKKRRQA